MVDDLVKAGANLGGSDFDGGFATLAIQNAMLAGDQNTLSIWAKTGIRVPARQVQETITADTLVTELEAKKGIRR